MTPTASPTPAPSPAIRWVNADAEPTDQFLDALVAMLWHVVQKRRQAAAAGVDHGDGDQAGQGQDQQHHHGGPGL